jgi:crotonobetainyl-CoA:carnitine CoA-transferase CaiB-like acyl-CoA transferase
MAGALSGTRVIDFGQYIAGPLTGMLLADQGADVIRVDPPGGPVWQPPANATWNRGKRSILLDLKLPQDLETAKALIAGADVLIENFRPGVMIRLGLGSAEMTTLNPRLVYCSMPGFASDDPRAGVRAFEGVVGAASGTYRINPAIGHPTYTAVPIASTYAAFQAAVSIAMALNVRERDGIGQTIEVPLFDAMFGANGNRILRVHNRPQQDLAAMAARMGVSGQFECKDGRWVMYMGGNLRARDFLEATGAAEWVDAVRDGKMTTEELRQRAEEMFRRRTAQEWEDFSHEVGTECAVCRTSAEWLVNEQARQSRIIIESEDPVLGRMVQPGINVRMSATPGEVRAPRPLPDAHRKEVLADLSSRSPAGPLRDAEDTMRAALEGVRVLDLCIILAGPTCGRTLAEFGADVVKIDNPGREAVAFHNDINRAKRSILLDIKTKEGLEIFWKLVDNADVVVQNFRKGVAERLGIGYEAVRARKPDIVYASMNTYGQLGPWAGRPGHEQIAQAASGMQERYGGSGRPTLQPFAVNDYGTGFMGAYGVALALLDRQRTGQGQHVDTGLAYTACILQSQFLQDYEGKRWDEPRGQDAIGSGPLHRSYRASDGWLFLAARRDDLPRLEKALALPGLDELPNESLAARLEQCIGGESLQGVVQRLVDHGIGSHAVINDPAKLIEDPWVQAHGLVVTREHEDLGPITTTGPTPRLSRTPPAPGRPAPKPGADAASILAEIGMENELAGLVERGAVRLDGVFPR